MVWSYAKASSVALQLETVDWTTAGEILEKVRQLGDMLTKAHTHGECCSVLVGID